MIILIPLFASLFFLLGHYVTKIFKHKDNMFNFSLGIAFITLLGISLFDLLPEVYEIYENFPNKLIVVWGMILLGIALFGFLDNFTHQHAHDDNKDHYSQHLFHISVATTIALVFHNFVEGVFIYFAALSSVKTGIILAFAVGLHNIPLGMQISSNLELANKRKTVIFLTLILSTFIGGLVGMIFKESISIYILGAILAITAGMTIYIALFELLKEIFRQEDKAYSIFGIICGIILLLIASFI